jgi:hypothetical protein
MAFLLIVFSPILWYVIENGPKWRHATQGKKGATRKEKRKEKADGGEKGLWAVAGLCPFSM